jgi:hypothetical protein
MPSVTASGLGVAPPPMDNLPPVGIYSDTTLFLNGIHSKTITITNNSTQTIYPFISGENTGLYQAHGFNTPYDTQDTADQEYRLYVGYYSTSATTPTKYYFGLTPNSSVTVAIPLVFWDSARVYFATSPQYFTNTDKVQGSAAVNNPYNYFAYNTTGNPTLRFIDDPTKAGNNTTVKGTNGDTTAGDYPVVMYYHATVPNQPVNEAPTQLLEFSARDPYQNTLNPNLPGPSSPYFGDLGPLVNYDDSYVDSIAFPATLETRAGNLLGGSTVQAPYGWIGAPQSMSDFQQAVVNFTSSNTPANPNLNGLGQFFGGQGWSTYYDPFASTSGIKLPSTKNVFEQSPLLLQSSNYRTGTNSTVEHAVLSSGGVIYRMATNPITPGNTNNGEIAKVGDNTITNVDYAVIQQLAVGMTNIDTAYFPAGTTITQLVPAPGSTSTPPATGSIVLSAGALQASPNGKDAFTFLGSQFQDNPGTLNATTSTITLNNPAALASLQPGYVVQILNGGNLQAIGTITGFTGQTINVALYQPPAASGPYSFTFSGEADDYVAQQLLDLWYAWADYYVDYVTNQKPYAGLVTSGSIPALSNALTFTSTLPNLMVGEIVQAANGNGLPQDGTTTFITSINTATNTVYLSQAASSNGSGSYTFSLPTYVPRDSFVPSDANNPDKLSFLSAAQAQANQFAATAYTVMEGFAQIPQLRSAVDGSMAGININTLQGKNLIVTTTTGFPQQGTILVSVQGGGTVQVSYNGTSKTSFNNISTTGSGFLYLNGLIYTGGGNTNFSSLAFMQNVIGGNVGFIPNLGTLGVGSPTGQLYTIDSKSLERGVANYTIVDESQWYPDPSVASPGVMIPDPAMPGQTMQVPFDVYTLDPYAWFIHKSLGVSGYAFSLDDDKGDVGAAGANSLDINIGGLAGFPNLAEYSAGAPFGPPPQNPVQGTLVYGTNGAPDQITNISITSTPNLFNYLRQPNLADNVVGAFVLGPGIQPGTKIAGYSITSVGTITLDTKLLPGFTGGSYTFFGPVHITGTIDPSSGNSTTITGIDANTISVLKQITTGITLPNALAITGPGIPAAPTILGTSPASAAPGTQITILGTNLASVNAVKFFGSVNAVSPSRVSATQLVVTVPSDAKTGQIVINSTYGLAYSGLPFIVPSGPGSSIVSFSPNNAPVGTLVTILGTNLGNTNAVKFPGAPSAVVPVSVSATQVTAMVPANTTTGAVGIIGIGGNGADITSPTNFTVSPPNSPTISAFSPASGAAGMLLTINGTNLANVSAVKFGNLAPVVPVSVSPTQVTVVVPQGVQVGQALPITVGGGGGQGFATSATSFIVTNALVDVLITSIGTNSITVNTPLDVNQTKGTYRFKLT